MDFVDLFPVIFPQGFEHAASLLLPLGTVAPTFVGFGLLVDAFVFTSLDALDDVLLFGKPETIVHRGPGHHLEGLTFVLGDGLLYVGGAAVDDLALGAIDDDELPFLLVVLVPDDGVDILILLLEEGRFVKQEDGDF